MKLTTQLTLACLMWVGAIAQGTPPSVIPRSDAGLPSAFSDQGFPECSKQCVIDFFSIDGCGHDDVACHCANTAAREALFNNCVTKACGPPCQSKYQDAFEATCKTATGVIVPRLPQTPVNQFEAPGSPKCPFNAYPPVPECSQRCFNTTVFTDGCCLADAACHCSKHAAFQDNFSHCVVNDCPMRSQQKAYIKALTDSCHSVCVNVPAGSQLTLPPRPSGTHHAKPGRVRRDTPAIISSAVASGHGEIVSSILGGLGPIVSNITAINPTAPTSNAANQTSGPASHVSGIASSANASTTTLTSTGSDVAATATLTATAVASASGNSSISTGLSSGTAGLSSEPAGLLAQIVLGMTCWILLLV